jgi:hypothetical protein
MGTQMMMRATFAIVMCLGVAACTNAGPSSQKIAAAKAECDGQTTPVAHAKCLNEVERREFPDPYPDLANIVYSARVDLAQKVEAKQLTPEAAEFEFSKIVAQVHDQERRRASATAAAMQRRWTASASDCRTPDGPCNQSVSSIAAR